MSEAPKKIWMMKNPEAWATKDDMFNTPYIRADIVDELVEALKAMLDLIRAENDGELLTVHEARAALAKLEESHEV